MFVRVSLRYVGEGDDRCRFDLSVGPDLFPLADKVYFGSWGALDGLHESYGAALTTAGLIDLGSVWGAVDRLNKTNLLQRKMEPGQYVTIWWKSDGKEEECTYVVESVLQLSALTDLVKLPDASSFLVPELAKLPRFRARVIKSFGIKGYDDVVYRPPIGVEGDVANFQGSYVFCPDNAIARNGDLITARVDIVNLEMVLDSAGL